MINGMDAETGPRSSTRADAREFLVWLGPPFAAAAVLAVPLLFGWRMPHPAWQLWRAFAIAIPLAFSWGSLATTDRVAFGSIAIPTLGMAVVGLPLSGTIANELALAAIGFLVLLGFPEPKRWWWRVVLRRPGQAFGDALKERLEKVAEAYTAIMNGPFPAPDGALHAFDAAVASLLELHPPDGEWRAIRDRYFELERTLGEMLRGSPTVEELNRLGDDLVEVRTRSERQAKVRA